MVISCLLETVKHLTTKTLRKLICLDLFNIVFVSVS